MFNLSHIVCTVLYCTVLVVADESDRMTALVTSERNRATETDNLVTVLQAAVVELEIEKGRLESTIALNEAQYTETVSGLEQRREAWLGTDAAKKSRLQVLEASV